MVARQSDTTFLARPLYDAASKAIPICPPSAHAGLWYAKFCDHWKGQWAAPEVQKLDWIRTVANGRPIGDAPSLNDFARRQQNLVEAIKGKWLRLQTESRFVTGLGREHPVENGFAWHPTLGTPYLPGSSIKGMIRAWASQWEEDNSRRASLDEILGSEARDNGHPAQAGKVIIFDAVPLPPVNLELDVMTPHYGEYYQEGKPPGDWINPSPIPFLVVAEGSQFQFAFAPRTAAGREHLETVEVWLIEALQWLGAGAKTAIGYGRFGGISAEHPDSQDEHSPNVGDTTSSTPLLPPANHSIEAVLQEKNHKGTWKAKHLPSGIVGSIVNSQEVPSELNVGNSLELIVNSPNPSNASFRYPTDTEKQRAERSIKKSKAKGNKRRKS